MTILFIENPQIGQEFYFNVFQDNWKFQGFPRTAGDEIQYNVYINFMKNKFLFYIKH